MLLSNCRLAVTAGSASSTRPINAANASPLLLPLVLKDTNVSRLDSAGMMSYIRAFVPDSGTFGQRLTEPVADAKWKHDVWRYYMASMFSGTVIRTIMNGTQVQWPSPQSKTCFDAYQNAGETSVILGDRRSHRH